jgi:hypothetical protein
MNEGLLDGIRMLFIFRRMPPLQPIFTRTSSLQPMSDGSMGRIEKITLHEFFLRTGNRCCVMVLILPCCIVSREAVTGKEKKLILTICRLILCAHRLTLKKKLIHVFPFKGKKCVKRNMKRQIKNECMINLNFLLSVCHNLDLKLKINDCRRTWWVATVCAASGGVIDQDAYAIDVGLSHPWIYPWMIGMSLMMFLIHIIIIALGGGFIVVTVNYCQYLSM